MINASNANNSFLQFRCAGTGSGSNTLFGNLNNVDPFIRSASWSSVMRFQNSVSTDLMTIDNSVNCVHLGNMNCVNVVASGTGSFGTLVGDTTVKNGTSNTSFKIQGNIIVYRYETQTGDSHCLWNNSNQEVYHISSDRQIWFQSDVNCAGTYYDSGVLEYLNQM